jgi:hypothetical protein
MPERKPKPFTGFAKPYGIPTENLTETSRKRPGDEIVVASDASGDATDDLPCVFEVFCWFRKGRGVILSTGTSFGGLFLAVTDNDTLLARCGGTGTRVAEVEVPLAELPSKGYVIIEVRGDNGIVPRLRLWINRYNYADRSAQATSSWSRTGSGVGYYFGNPLTIADVQDPHTDPAGGFLRIFRNQLVGLGTPPPGPESFTMTVGDQTTTIRGFTAGGGDLQPRAFSSGQVANLYVTNNQAIILSPVGLTQFRDEQGVVETIRSEWGDTGSPHDLEWNGTSYRLTDATTAAALFAFLDPLVGTDIPVALQSVGWEGGLYRTALGA